MPASIADQLAGLLGSDAAVPEHLLEGYAVEGLIPRAAIRPANREGVAQALTWASSEKVAVCPWGGGTQVELGNVPGRMDLVLDLGRLDTVLDFQPEDLTVTVEAGITLGALRSSLAQGGMALPVEAPLASRATIGGILATNTSGPRRFAYGLPRDWLIGISIVSTDGTETKAGGKVVKNVTGYDMNRLYTGSLGTLGVIVDATFKLAPLPAHSYALAAGFDSLGEALEAGRSLLGQPYSPEGIQVLNGAASRRWDGADDHPGLAFAFFEGPTAQVVERRAQECSDLLRQTAAMEVGGLSGARYPSMVSQLADLGWDEGSKPYLAIKVNLPPSKLGGFVEECCREAPLGVEPGVVADVGFGVVKLFWWLGQDPDTVDEEASLAAIQRIRSLTKGAGGNAIVERCPSAVKSEIDVWGDTPEAIDIMRRIKEKFDPSGILNPGRFVGGI